MSSMPSRNIARSDVSDAHYHVYARGASKQTIFPEPADSAYLLHLLERYLSPKPAVSDAGVTYPNFHEVVELLAFCLMGNHFHLLVYQKQQGTLSGFMKSLMTSYSRYFNLKYRRSGSLFENRYKASLITSDAYLLHISRYIHLNPRSWRRYPYSSFRYYDKGDEPEWLQTARVLAMYADRAAYAAFIADYEDQKKILDELKYELADQ